MNKSPKEILLEQHRATDTKLDALREGVLLAELGPRAPSPRPPGISPALFLQKIWLELIWPSRKAWGGLAAIWVVLAVVHLASTPSATPLSPSSNLQIAADWREQQQLLALLTNQRAPAPASPPLPAAPPPPADKSAGLFTREITTWA